MRKRQFNTDCEGPISLNDNAYELTRHFIPNGDVFFTQISKYDDILADIVKRPGYKAGDTLKLILPFLKAYGATDASIKAYSAGNVIMVPGAESSLRYINSMMPAFIISTSYEPYLNALCDLIGFDREHVYCTRLDMDKYRIDAEEAGRLKDICEEICSLPKPDVKPGVKDFSEVSGEVRGVVKTLDEFFFGEIASMKSGDILTDVNPVGGVEKANAVLHSLEVTGNSLQDVMYVGDSITDVNAFHLVKDNGGLTVAFNGNRYAIKEAEIACISGHAAIVSIMADMFSRRGKEGVLLLVENWSADVIRQHIKESVLPDQIEQIFEESLPIIEIITENNRERLTIESEAFRKTVRGEEVGSLG